MIAGKLNRMLTALVLILSSIISLTGCGSSSNTTSSNVKLMGGGVQGKALALAGTVSTFAGQPAAASAPVFNHAQGITSDGTNLYVADSANFAILKVEIATGTVTTLAGGSGGGATDGTATAARFASPTGITSDGTNLYVSDGSTIRKVVIATGAVTTVAGSPGVAGSSDGIGSAASFFSLSGITTDGTYLYVVDAGNDTVRKVEIATGTVTTVAGSGSHGISDGVGASASFFDVRGISVVGTNLYVADFAAIRKIEIATGAVTTVAGSSTTTGSTDGIGSAASFYYPSGITSDGTSLYITEPMNHTIRQMKLATSTVTTLAGSALRPGGLVDGTGAGAKFVSPTGITTDGANLYVTDVGTNAIRKVVIGTAAVTTLAGNAGSVGSTDGSGASARFNNPLGITTDGTNLYVADTDNGTIRRVVIATGAVTTLAGSTDGIGLVDGVGAAARFNQPKGITTDGKQLYVTDCYNHAIRRIDLATGAVTTLAGGSSGADDGTGAAAKFWYPSGITTDGTNLYVLESTNALRKVVIATGTVTTLVAGGSGSTSKFDMPSGVTTDGTNLYVASTYRAVISKVAIATGAVTTLAGSPNSIGLVDGTGSAARFGWPTGIATDGSYLYVTDGNVVRKVVIATGAVTTVTDAANDFPSGITTDGKMLYAVNGFSNNIDVIK